MDELLDVHAHVSEQGGPGLGTVQLERALIQLLTSEFQGFARDMHDEAIEVVHRQMIRWNAVWADAIEQLLRSRRDVDRGNASPSRLASDFDRFGLDLWPDLIQQDSRFAQWQGSLERLNLARNAIAHDDDRKFGQLRHGGVTLDLATFREWRYAADAVATGIDGLLAAHLARTLGPGVPW